MNMSLNSNVSKEFRKAIRVATYWKKGKNPKVSVVTSSYKNANGKDVKVYERKNANDVWGKPYSFSMK
jgi:hypothetical protein